jgi:hypothetical protein
MSYLLGINEKKQVQTLYWGKRLSHETPPAMTSSTLPWQDNPDIYDALSF